MSPNRVALTASALLVGAFLATPARAQTDRDVRITKERTTEFGGSMGVTMRLFGMGETETEIFSIHGEQPISRTDAGSSSTITNFLDGSIVVENHDDESYYRMTVDEMMDLASQFAGAPTTPRPADAPTEPEDTGVRYEVSAEVVRPGDTKVVDSMELELIRMIFTATPVEAEDIDPEQLPIYVMVSDQWMVDEAPGNEAMARLGEAAYQQLQEQSAGYESGAAMQQALFMNNALKSSYEDLAEKMKDVDGFPIEHVVAFVTLMPGAELDLEAALTAPLAGPDVDFGKLAREGAKGAVEEAVRGRLGRLGRLGRRNRDEEKEAAPTVPEGPQQAVILRMTEKRIGTVIGPLPAGWTDANPEYTEKPSPLEQMRNR